MNTTNTSSTHQSSIEQFLAEAIVRAKAAADACTALHRSGGVQLSESDWHELDAACERWLERRSRSQRLAA